MEPKQTNGQDGRKEKEKQSEERALRNKTKIDLNGQQMRN
jgi:hypothetical protein